MLRVHIYIKIFFYLQLYEKSSASFEIPVNRKLFFKYIDEYNDV